MRPSRSLPVISIPLVRDVRRPGPWATAQEDAREKPRSLIPRDGTNRSGSLGPASYKAARFARDCGPLEEGAFAARAALSFLKGEIGEAAIDALPAIFGLRLVDSIKRRGGEIVYYVRCLLDQRPARLQRPARPASLPNRSPVRRPTGHLNIVNDVVVSLSVAVNQIVRRAFRS
jgi:hypothetical protein